MLVFQLPFQERLQERDLRLLQVRKLMKQWE
jgi:hypothetical protein